MPTIKPHIRDIPLLQTKISIPRIPTEFVHRPRLTERINRGVKGPLTLLAAPAGFGKTNLLIEWAENTSLPVAWLTIDSADNDLNRLFRYIIGALQTLEPNLGEEALDFLQSTQSISTPNGDVAISRGVEIGLTLLINEIAALQKELVLVLDDFHALENPVIIQSAGHFLKQMPSNLHLVIASRNEPELDLAFLRAKGHVVELGEHDLRFSSDEIGQYFYLAMGLQLPVETLQTLEQRTEGWVTALQMAALSLHNRSSSDELLDSLSGNAHYLVDFLAEEVLDRQPEDIRQFLLRSSILDTLSGPLCEAVVNPEAQPGYGAAMLNRLEHDRLFITALDDRHEMFRYHNLFADFLRHIQAEINPTEIPVLQKRAALWYEQHESLEEAFEYALAYATSSGDFVWAADLIQRNIITMIKTGEVFSLTKRIGQLPEEVIHQRPRLSLTYAWGLIAAYQLDLASYWLDDLQKQLAEIEKQPQDESQESISDINQQDDSLWNISGGLAICQSTLAMLRGDVEEAAEFSRQATRNLPDENPFVKSMFFLDDSLYFILSGDTVQAIESLRQTVQLARQANNMLVAIIATCQLADMLVLQGQLNQAWATLRKAQYLTLGPDGKPLPMAGLVDIGFGEILLERGSLEEAHTYLERGYQASQSLWSFNSLDSLISLARLHQALGDTDGTQAIITEAASMVFSTESSQWDDSLISGVATRLALQRGDLAQAEQWWIRGGLPDLSGTIRLEDYPYHVFEYLALTQARFLLKRGWVNDSQGDIEHASEVLGVLLPQVEQFQRVTSKIEIYILQALIMEAQGDERAKELMLKALALGEPQGYQRIYLDEGSQLHHLLIQCRAFQQSAGGYLPSLTFIDQLLETLPGIDTATPLMHHPIEPPESRISLKNEDGLPIHLSAREMEVLKLIAEGKSNQEISAQLYLALNTVKRHAYNIYAKLGVRKRTQAVSVARRLNIIP